MAKCEKYGINNIGWSNESHRKMRLSIDGQGNTSPSAQEINWAVAHSRRLNKFSTSCYWYFGSLPNATRSVHCLIWPWSRWLKSIKRTHTGAQTAILCVYVCLSVCLCYMQQQFIKTNFVQTEMVSKPLLAAHFVCVRACCALFAMVYRS